MNHQNDTHQIPWRELWLDADQVSELTGYSPRYVRDVLAKRSSFPTGSGGGKGTRLAWKAGEIDDWMNKRRTYQGGRPRIFPSAEGDLRA